MWAWVRIPLLTKWFYPIDNVCLCNNIHTSPEQTTFSNRCNLLSMKHMSSKNMNDPSWQDGLFDKIIFLIMLCSFISNMWYVMLTWAVWEYIINMCVRKYIVLCASALDTFDIIERMQYRNCIVRQDGRAV